MWKIRVLLLGLLGVINVSHAALQDAGGGLVNDSTLDLTWMKDANVFKTLCDASDPVATGFIPVDTVDAATVCANDGAMTWNDAEAWIARLNAQNYLGVNDWRQPLTPQPDATCEEESVPGQGVGFNCRGSELGHLFNISLGNPNDAGTGATGGAVGTACSGVAPHCFQNTAPFENSRAFAYWSGSSFAPTPTLAWYFNTDFGFQFIGTKVGVDLFVWPARSGQSVVAPVTAQSIPTLSVWAMSLMIFLIGFVARRRI